MLYQLSYCGVRALSLTRFLEGKRLGSACAPDTGHGADWQGKRWPPTELSAAPARQETAPAAGLRSGADLLRKFVRRRIIVDPGIVGSADNRDHRRDREAVWYGTLKITVRQLIMIGEAEIRGPARRMA